MSTAIMPLSGLEGGEEAGEARLGAPGGESRVDAQRGAPIAADGQRPL
jgi:hypothetical protein